MQKAFLWIFTSFLMFLSPIKPLEIDNYVDVEYPFYIKTDYIEKSEIKEFSADLDNLENLRNFTSLQRFWLRGRQGEEFPLEIANLKQLEELYIVGFQKVPLDILENLSELRKLAIIDCSIKNYNDFSKLGQIRHLYIHNAKDNVELNAFDTMNLETLSITKSSLIEVTRLLKNNETVTKLNLSENKIRDYSSLLKIAQLKELNLSGNRIEIILIPPFNSAIETLNLSGNRIRNLSMLKSAKYNANIIAENQIVEEEYNGIPLEVVLIDEVGEPVPFGGPNLIREGRGFILADEQKSNLEFTITNENKTNKWDIKILNYYGANIGQTVGEEHSETRKAVNNNGGPVILFSTIIILGILFLKLGMVLLLKRN